LKLSTVEVDLADVARAKDTYPRDPIVS